MLGGSKRTNPSRPARDAISQLLQHIFMKFAFVLLRLCSRGGAKIKNRIPALGESGKKMWLSPRVGARFLQLITPLHREWYFYAGFGQNIAGQSK